MAAGAHALASDGTRSGRLVNVGMGLRVGPFGIASRREVDLNVDRPVSTVRGADYRALVARLHNAAGVTARFQRSSTSTVAPATT